jgi:hypothetical protein
LKNCLSFSDFSVRFYLQLCVWGLMFYLRYLCIVVSNTYYVMCFVSFVFVFCLVYPILIQKLKKKMSNTGILKYCWKWCYINFNSILIQIFYWIKCINCLLSCVPNIASFSEFSILGFPFGFLLYTFSRLYTINIVIITLFHINPFTITFRV